MNYYVEIQTIEVKEDKISIQVQRLMENTCKNVYKEKSLRLFVEIIGLANKIEYINLNKKQAHNLCIAAF